MTASVTKQECGNPWKIKVLDCSVKPGNDM